MALSSGLSQTIQTGIREDLADYISVVDAKSIPFVSMAPKSRDLGNMLFSWQVDGYAAAKLGGVADGVDVTVGSSSNASNARVKLSNYAQVFRRDAKTGFIAQTQNVAGVPSEKSRAAAKRLVEIKRDMEATFLCANQPAQVESATDTPYHTASLGQWLTVTPAAEVGKPTSAYAPASGAVISTATASFTESVVQAQLEAIYGATGSNRTFDAIVGTKIKRAFTSLTAPVTAAGTSANNGITSTSIRAFNMDLNASVYRSSVDIFEGDFGRIIVTPDTFTNTTDASATAPAITLNAFKGYVIPMDMVEIRYTEMPTIEELPNNGGGPVIAARAIAGLVVRNPRGFGMYNGTA